MATDVVPGLNEAIQTSFKSNVMKDRRIAQISKRIRDGTATFEDGHEYAARIGEDLSKALSANLTANTLPDGRLYYNIAQRTVTPALEETYNLTNDVAADIQKIYDKKSKIGLGTVKADFPSERIQGLIDKMTTDGITLDEALKWIGEPIINNAEAFFDDFIDSNARFRADVGLKAKLIRKAEPNCCKWCADLEGEWDYGDAPEDVYRRHEFCRCSVIYETRKDRQDVWSKRTWQTSEEDLARRRDTGQKVEISPQERIEVSNRIYKETIKSEMRRQSITKKYAKLSPEERVSLYDQAIKRRAQGKG